MRLRVLLLFCLFLFGGYAHAATYTVSKIDDTNDGVCDADCSLREAINAANSAAGDDKIAFSVLSGVLQLNSELPPLSSNIILQGPGANLLTIQGQGTTGGYRIFTISNGTRSGPSVAISGLTISGGGVTTPPAVAGGEFGGGIFIDYGRLDLTACVVSHNTAYQGGGIATYIFSAPILNISNCTLSSNFASNVGGGLYSRSSNALLTNCTVSGNYANGDGGGLRNINGNMNLQHCTIANNTADADGTNGGVGSGIADVGLSLTLKHTLLTRNYLGGIYQINNIAEQRNPGEFQIVSEGYNLADDGAGGFLNGPGDLINTNPSIGPLQYNGGPTPTHDLPKRVYTNNATIPSPAINAGDPNFAPPPNFDGRGPGFARLRGGRVDIGAYESQQPDISFSDAAFAEGDSGTTDGLISVTLSQPADEVITVNWTTLASYAFEGEDYVGHAGTITFQPGDTVQTIVLKIVGDTKDENDERFVLNLEPPTNAEIPRPYCYLTILDNDEPPTASIENGSVMEGQSGQKFLVFPVRLSAPSGKVVDVAFATTNGTAQDGTDYVGTSQGSVVFGAEVTQQYLRVLINGDTEEEFNETFSVKLRPGVYSPDTAVIGNSNATGTILNDDFQKVSISDISIQEPDSGTVAVPFKVNLSAPSIHTVTINAIPVNGTAKATADYVARGARLIFQPGETSKTFSVPVNADTLPEAAENFFVLLSSPVNCAIADGRGICTIVDNDAPPTISIDNLSIKEYNAGQTTAAVRLKLSSPSGQVVKVNFATTSDTATAGSDYVATSGTVAFTTGNLYAYARVLINGDELNEQNETFKVNLSNPVNATIAGATSGSGQSTVTILNDDAAPALIINDFSVTEGNSGTKNLTFTVSLSKPSGQNVTINYATSDGVARSTSDYMAQSGTLTFTPGETDKAINISVNGDTQVEGDETFFVLLSNALNANISKARGSGTIVNDDASG